MLTLGVEEEYLLVDPDNGTPRSEFDAVRESSRIEVRPELQPELLQSQVEVATPVCQGIGEVGDHLRRLRQGVAEAAARHGIGLIASGSAPLSPDPHPPVTTIARYQAMRTDARQLVDEQLICGMHVHVAMPSRATAVHVLNRLRPWLPVLVALGANSPLWQGRDTGFASWRTVVFGRWPVTGIPPVFADIDDYDTRLEGLRAAQVIRDRGQVYWLARISERYPTLEVRALDVQLRVREAEALAGLVRALVTTVLAEHEQDVPYRPPQAELLNGALWHAARYGLTDSLIDHAGRRVPAAEAVRALLEHVRPALEAAGEEKPVAERVEALLREGTAAEHQRRLLATRGTGGLTAFLTDQTGAA